MTGIVTAIIRRSEDKNGGYGFIRDENNAERFFHARNMAPGGYTKLREGANVSFDAFAVPVVEGSKSNGLRADHVVVL